jgi:cell division protein FtsB
MNGHKTIRRSARRGVFSPLLPFPWLLILAWFFFRSPALLGDTGIPGRVTVTIEPPEAVADGALWSLDGNPEQASGLSEDNVFPGRHDVRFRDLPAWREPEKVDVLVVGGKEAQVTATYRRLPSFFQQAIPEQHARAGQTVEFLVRTEEVDDPQNPNPAAGLAMTAQPQPAGNISLDAATGRFAYTPVPADRLPFTVTFTTAEGLSGTAVITPLNSLPPEDTVIEYNRPLPDDESRDYMTITEKKNPTKVFNDAQQETLSVDISGQTLVFEAGHPAHLFETYNHRNNLETLYLYADKIIIRSPLVLPQTHVTIHARELRFEADGSINTTPKARALKPAGAVWEDDLTHGINGDPGHAGGDIDVFVERFHSDPGQSDRFILEGGNGGPAGEGRDGRSELTVAFLSADWHKLMNRCGNPFCGSAANSSVMLYSEDWFGTQRIDTCGRKVTARGENAVPSGKPGNGGAGGTLRSTLNLLAQAQLSGGDAGAKGNNYTGGALSARKFIYRVTRTTIVKGEEVVSVGDTIAPKAVGQDAAAPNADVPVGAAGHLELAQDPGVWLHSFAVREVVRYAKDAYLNGHTAETRQLLSEYRDLILAYQREPAPGEELSDEAFLEKVNLDQLLVEIETLIHRIDSNLDYFGNPAGWVPMLSFEANLVAFQNEIDQSIPVLYLAYWLNHAATNLESSLDASVQAKQDLEDELEDMVNAFNEAQTAIPRLKVEAEAIKIRIAAVQVALTNKLHELEARAQQNIEDRHKVPFWKKALGVLAVAADLVPVGQPAVGRIGSGLGLLSQVDSDKPFESASAITPKAFDVFSQKNITVCFGGTNSTSNTSTNTTKKAKQDNLKSLTECGKFLGGELKELSEVFKQAQVDKTELEAELEKLKAVDPVFNELTQEVKDLNDQKEEFAQKLAAALQAVATLTSSMTENLIATHEIESRLEAGLAALDHGALLHIKEMEQRAKDRLLQYQYFLSKSFQYRRLKPYSGNLQLNRLFDRFEVLVEAGNSHLLSSEEFDQLKFLFVDELRQIVAEMFDNFNAPERSLPVSFKLTAEELDQLNTAGRVVINLKDRGLLEGHRENIRISDLRVHDIAVHPVGGSIGNHALVNVNFEHLGISRLTSAGKTFLFRHYQTETVNPIVWNAVYDGLQDTLDNSELSPAQQSLIAVLLNLEPSTPPNLLLFSRPAAWADILITKEVSTDNGIDMAIDDLHVEVQFDFYNTSGNERALAVNVTDDLDPVITVSQQDINGRQDGRGDFFRVFSPFSQVTLQAPANYGQWAFDRWVVNGQEAPEGVTAVLVNLTSDTQVQARFRPASSGDEAPLIAEEPLDQTVAAGTSVSFTVSATGGEPFGYQWQRNGVPLGDSAPFSGATTPHLVLGNVQADQAGDYSVVVTNAFGAVTSRAATLEVIDAVLTPFTATAGQVGFEFSTVAGLRYAIEHTPRLENPVWTEIEVKTGNGGVMQFTREIRADAMGFFRLRIETASPGE